MIEYLRKLRGELTQEQEILQNRLILGSVSVVGCYFFAFDTLILSAFVTYLALNTALYAMHSRDIWRAEHRWFAAIIIDVMTVFAVMLREPEHMAIFWPIILWMILANGFRYGIKWLIIAAALSAATFGILVISTAYWQQNLSLGIALVLALLVIPGYCSTLIRKISHAKEQAELASKAKSYFLASVSHELRTPLNAIIGYGNHLRQSDMPRSQKEMVEASVLAGEHLLHLIEQLIEVAKTGAGSAQVKNAIFRATDLVTEIRDIMAVRVEEKGLTLNLQAEPLSDRLINGPVDVVRNILLNLVGNAVKFTESGSISINSGFDDAPGQGFIWFTVADTGIGIAESAIERIFQPFQQADETVLDRFGGTGLGLSICKQLIEQVHGSISVVSEIGQGSRFRIEIPVEHAAGETAYQDHPAEGTVHILSFGEIEPGLLASAQSQDNFIVRHVGCRTAAELETVLDIVALRDFSVALMSEKLAKQLGPDSNVWRGFDDAEIGTVLVLDTEAIDIEDASFRTAFASVLPASPDFPKLQSAIRIACSFARHFRLPQDDDTPAVSIYRPQKILVADDNRTNRNVLAAILESVGHEVTMATDGDEALEAVAQGGVDILLLDINMPRLNGIDACTMWREIEGDDKHLPIIGVTADATAETEQRCLDAGMDMRITKPVDAKLLLAVIEQHCGGEPREETVSSDTNDHSDVVVSLADRKIADSGAIDRVQIDYLFSIGDTAFVQSMIDGFFEDVDQILEPLRQAVITSDLSEFRFCAHALKSSGNNMGAKRLASYCARMEQIPEPDFALHRHEYLAQIEDELTQAIAALRESAAQPALAPVIGRTG